MNEQADDLHGKLTQKCDPIVKHYRKDLWVHDRNWIDDHYPMPFIHFTRECGTHIFGLEAKCDLPDKDVQVKYLFGHADREHIISDTQTAISSCCDSKEHKLLLYFDGKELKEVTRLQAIRIVTAWAWDLRFQIVEETKCQ